MRKGARPKVTCRIERLGRKAERAGKRRKVKRQVEHTLYGLKPFTCASISAI
jgi:hypothetical protein